MSWVTLIIAILKVLNNFVGYLGDRQLLTAGAKSAIGDETFKILKRVETANEIEKRVASLSDDDVDKRLSERGDFRPE